MSFPSDTCASCGNHGRNLDRVSRCRRCVSDPPAFPVGTLVAHGKHRGSVTRCRWVGRARRSRISLNLYRYTVAFSCGHTDEITVGLTLAKEVRS